MQWEINKDKNSKKPLRGYTSTKERGCMFRRQK